MAICSKCLKRLIIRIIGITGMFLAHFLLKRTGKLLHVYGKCELWGWSTRLITTNIYKCIRHPHHLGVGVFMTFLGLLVGYPITYLIISISQWLWILLFVLFIEEKECLEKFGDQYIQYKKVSLC